METIGIAFSPSGSYKYYRTKPYSEFSPYHHSTLKLLRALGFNSGCKAFDILGYEILGFSSELPRRPDRMSHFQVKLGHHWQDYGPLGFIRTAGLGSRI